MLSKKMRRELKKKQIYSFLTIIILLILVVSAYIGSISKTGENSGVVENTNASSTLDENKVISLNKNSGSSASSNSVIRLGGNSGGGGSSSGGGGGSSGPICGNGVVEETEQCDDGNNNNNDGCNNQCKINYDYGCTGGCGCNSGDDEWCKGEINDACISGGFDFAVVKWEYNNSWYVNGSNMGTSVNGTDSEAYWDVGSSIADGIVTKAANNCRALNGTNGTQNKIERCGLSFILFCGYNATEFCGDGIKQENEECDDGNNDNGDGCDENCELEVCEHDVGIRFSYGNSFGTGIAIKPEDGDWISEKPANLIEGKNYTIKYYIDNKIENSTNNIHVVVKIDDIVLADYDKEIINYHYKEIDLDTSSLSGNYNISVYVEKVNEIDCNLSDNYAEREIIINAVCVDGIINGDEDCEIDEDCPIVEHMEASCNDCSCEYEPVPYCGDGIKNGNEQCEVNSEVEDCDDGNNKTSDSCNPLECACEHEPIPYCGDGNLDVGEECDDGNNIGEDGCSADCEIEEIRCREDLDCGIDDWLSEEYCVCTKKVFDFLINYKCINPGTIKSYCVNSTEIKLKEECGLDYCEEWENTCYNNDVYKERACYDKGCSAGECFNNEYEDKEKIEECYSDYCESEWSYYCKDDDVYKNRTCYDKGCEAGSCFIKDYEEDLLFKNCSGTCENGQCIDIECYKDDDCGIDGWLGEEFCWCDKLFDYWIDYSCLSQGTPESSCISSTRLKVKGDCSFGLSSISSSACTFSP